MQQAWYKTDCPKLKKKSNKSKAKKAMIATWSDSESLILGEEEKSNEVANLCLMALESEEMSQAEMKESGSKTNSLEEARQEVQSSEFISDNNLGNAFDELYIEFEKLSNKTQKA